MVSRSFCRNAMMSSVPLPRPYIMCSLPSCAETKYAGTNASWCHTLEFQQVITNLAEYGNTSAGSIPLALDEAVRSGKVSRAIHRPAPCADCSDRLCPQCRCRAIFWCCLVLRTYTSVGNVSLFYRSRAMLHYFMVCASPPPQVKSGDVIACAGFGAGLSWGAAIIRWSG